MNGIRSSLRKSYADSNPAEGRKPRPSNRNGCKSCLCQFFMISPARFFKDTLGKGHDVSSGGRAQTRIFVSKPLLFLYSSSRRMLHLLSSKFFHMVDVPMFQSQLEVFSTEFFDSLLSASVFFQFQDVQNDTGQRLPTLLAIMPSGLHPWSDLQASSYISYTNP